MKKSISKKLAQQFSGPIIFQYVWWMLSQAQARGIQRIYFLARDGYLLLKIAQEFCLKFKLNIECRYLYVSRLSLRLPSYHLIGDEAYDILLLGGYQVSRYSLMMRLGLNELERMSVYRDCGRSMDGETALLNSRAFETVCQELRKSQAYKDLIQRKARQAYDGAMAYFKQEGLFEQSTVAIADSGWTGSMQRSLRQLLASGGYRGNVVGFYFGMYVEGKDRADGEYLPWYFDQKSPPHRKALFCNNLLECLLSAPHGMTVSYSESHGSCEPVLSTAPTNDLRLITEQLQEILKYARAELSHIAIMSPPTAIGLANG